jgi:hypothetical protein
LLRKTNTSKRAELVRFAIQHDLVEWSEMLVGSDLCWQIGLFAG